MLIKPPGGLIKPPGGLLSPRGAHEVYTCFTVCIFLIIRLELLYMFYNSIIPGGGLHVPFDLFIKIECYLQSRKINVEDLILI